MMRNTLFVLATLAACALPAIACGTDSDGDAPPATISATAQGSRAQDAAVQAASCDYARPRGAYTRETVTSNGLDRQYVLHVPPSYPPSYDGLAPAPAPLLLVFHGGGVPAQSVIDLTAISKAAGERGMVAVFPEAIDSIWNALGAPAPTVDTDFATDLIADVAAKLCIDEHRVYAAGFSLGGSVAQLLGCAQSGAVAAVASVAALTLPCEGAVPLVAIHGDADPIARYEPVPRAVADWARALGCEAAPATSNVASDVELAAYGGCAGGGQDALLYTVRGGGHAWPGATFDFPIEVTGPTTHSISANELLLDFFEAHRR